ncbi:glycosyl transferase family 2 [Desulfosporosinus acididurans]|uniref:Glycosyl transferase family 2 n=1 Tax=Desulfosporosinus acididurans TaxID=476652 RepID=A0A0J1FLG9_9FIRM|nr:glycosyltransferase [Desulfosporosinus acididurans]KLU64369.1 glycosyl transferase family 2 [Desulfosporosinus acididurans]
MKIGVIIPIFNPPDIFEEVLDALLVQTVAISQVVLIDSSDMAYENQTFIRSKLDNKIKVIYEKIRPFEFDHGATRNLGAKLLGDSEIAVFLTQDAIIQDNCIEELVTFIERNNLSAAYARQIPRDGCSILERVEREFNYPEGSKINRLQPSTIEEVFFSNTCSAVRLKTFWKLGGFPEKIIFAEDMIFASRLLKAGYSTGYCSEAIVKHSHTIDFKENLKRYFDMGVMHRIFKDELPIRSSTKKGLCFVKKGIGFCLKNQPQDLMGFSINTLAKFIGYQLGKRYLLFPIALNIKLTKNRAYWNSV